MIFVILGSQKFQFNRLLKAIDKLVSEGKITDTVFAQIGHSDYIPQNFSYKAFMDRDEFSRMQSSADIIITHGGTGAIVGALKKGKKVIAVPRLSKYGEHVDDHQLQIIEEFVKLGFILECQNCDELYVNIEQIRNLKLSEYKSNTQTYIDSISEYINEL